MIHMKCQALFSWKKKKINKQNVSVRILFGTWRVKILEISDSKQTSKDFIGLDSWPIL